MLRPPVGALVFALAALALPSFALPHHRPKLDIGIHMDTRSQLQDIDLAATVATAQAQSDGADGLPQTWCGNELTSDDRADAVFGAGEPVFKVVYAYAADEPDRFSGWSDALQGDVAVADRFLSAQDGGTKALRFDMGTSCGPQFADIQTVALPGTRANYAGDFEAVASAVRTALGSSAGPRDALILADQLAPGDVEYGLGETIMGASGEQPGAQNPHNAGGLTSMLFTRAGDPAPGDVSGGWWPEGFLHEMTHNMGAVQWSAPHSTEPAGETLPQYGHCWQGLDVMCYVEDSGASHQMEDDCPAVAGTISETYDCGRDDYFNPAPAPGSYLATHWNVYDSVFLAPCAEIAPACGGGDGQGATPKPPTATSGPQIAGQVVRGKPLHVVTGAWLNRPTTFAYQWQRATKGTWHNLPGATSNRYTPTTRDLGRRLRVTVAAVNADGRIAAATAPTAQVGAVAVGGAAARRHVAHEQRRGR